MTYKDDFSQNIEKNNQKHLNDLQKLHKKNFQELKNIFRKYLEELPKNDKEKLEKNYKISLLLIQNITLQYLLNYHEQIQKLITNLVSILLKKLDFNKKIDYSQTKKIPYDQPYQINNIVYKNIEQFPFNKMMLLNKQIFYYDTNYSSDTKFKFGKLYSKEYDNDGNPKYNIIEITTNELHQDSYFQLENNSINIYGQGYVEYQGKSTIKKKKEQKEEKKEEKVDNNNQTDSLSIQEPPKKFKIKIMDLEGNQLNANTKPVVEVDTKWTKYNQLISNNDIKILSSNQWMTSSIIDSYVCYLNKKEQEKYFALPSIQNINRTIFFCSTVYTSFAEAYKGIATDTHLVTFKNEILEFQEQNFHIFENYKNQVFVINSNNSHWFLVTFFYQNKNQFIMQVIDSLGSNRNKQNQYKTYFNDLFNKTFQQQFEIQIIDADQDILNHQQNDGFSCGWHACHFMTNLYNKEFNIPMEQYDKKSISKYLLEIIKKQ